MREWANFIESGQQARWQRKKETKTEKKKDSEGQKLSEGGKEGIGLICQSPFDDLKPREKKIFKFG